MVVRSSRRTIGPRVAMLRRYTPCKGSPWPEPPLLRARNTTRPALLTDGWLKLLNERHAAAGTGASGTQLADGIKLPLFAIVCHASGVAANAPPGPSRARQSAWRSNERKGGAWREAGWLIMRGLRKSMCDASSRSSLRRRFRYLLILVKDVGRLPASALRWRAASSATWYGWCSQPAL